MVRNIVIAIIVIGLIVYVKTYGFVLPGHGPKGIHNQELKQFESEFDGGGTK